MNELQLMQPETAQEILDEVDDHRRFNKNFVLCVHPRAMERYGYKNPYEVLNILLERASERRRI